LILDSQEVPAPAVTYQPVLDLGTDELFFEASGGLEMLASSALATGRRFTQAARIRDPARETVALATCCIKKNYSPDAAL
jgi:hypothetical protein